MGSAVKVVIMWTGVICIGIVTKQLLFPMATYLYLNQAPHFVSWLRPPYLYVLINCIIISIAASSCFHNKQHQHKEQEPLHVPPVAVAEPMHEEEEEEEFVISRSKWVPPPPKRIDSSEQELLEAVVSYSPSPPPQKPLVSSRFSHRKPLRLTPQGARALGVSRPKRHETLENTWKTITEGRAMPLTRHLKKSETFYENQRAPQVNVSDENSDVKKSETFRDRTNYQATPVGGSSGKLRKEASPSQDELNRRVEAFISKFNEEMRLQRLESLNQYNEMVGRGI